MASTVKTVPISPCRSEQTSTIIYIMCFLYRRSLFTIFAVFWSELERWETYRKMSPKMSQLSLGKKLTHPVSLKMRLTTAKIEHS